MTFNSLQFLIFLPIVIVVYFILPHKVRWIWLLIASYYAYMSWNVWLVFLILGTTVVSYVAGLLIARTEKKSVKKFWLVLMLVVCLGVLVFFKYFNFLLGSVIDFLNLFALDIDSVALDIILPVGISFYTFQTLSYVIDVYRGMAPEKHFGYYALFVSYFPQLVAGPIERPENLIPQLREKHSPNGDDMAAGFRMLLTGFFRKCVVADFCGTLVDSVFADVSSANGLALLAAGALFAVQVYCDFAGYSEIAMGSARMMGIRLMKNFDRPFSATSIRELMRRWHISLNTWFRDYVYIPLGGNRKGKVRRVLNVLIVYFLCGLWHGANWTFVLWGMYIGVFLTIEGFLRKPYRSFCEKHGIDNGSSGVRMLRQCLVFLFFIPAALFFRAQSVAEIGEIFVRIFTAPAAGGVTAAMTALSADVLDLFLLAAVFVCLLMLGKMSDYGWDRPAGGERIKPDDSAADETVLLRSPDPSERTLYAGRAAACVYAITAIALGWLMAVAGDGMSAFVYFQF